MDFEEDDEVPSIDEFQSPSPQEQNQTLRNAKSSRGRPPVSGRGRIARERTRWAERMIRDYSPNIVNDFSVSG